MKLTVIGCSGSYPSASSPASCYLLEHDGTKLALDLGNGSIGAMANYLPVVDLDAVAISHFHPDHCADLASLYVIRRYDPAGQHPPIPVYGPAGISHRINTMYGAIGQDHVDSIFDFGEYGNDPIEIGPFTIEPFEVEHCVPAYALRVSAGGKTITYSGDTGPCEGLLKASNNADIALFEASYVETADNPPKMHLTGAQAGEIATNAGVGRLILTHLVAWNSVDQVLSEARSTFSGDLTRAVPGMTVTV